MGKSIDISGQKFGKLTVIGKSSIKTNGHTYWDCKCECGKELPIRGQSLRKGATKSCGCITSDPSYKNPRLIDLTGLKFGRLTVIGPSHKSAYRQTYWKCVCECGKETTPCGSDLKCGKTLSCGCLHSERASEANTTHGMSGTQIHKCWKNMLQRCTNPSNTAWEIYGGRGIRVCEQWAASFDAFAADMGQPPTDGHSIDRIDVNGNYGPGNCRWATDEEQARNKRNNVPILIDGKYASLREVCESRGLNYFATYHRIVRKGESISLVIG